MSSLTLRRQSRFECRQAAANLIHSGHYNANSFLVSLLPETLFLSLCVTVQSKMPTFTQIRHSGHFPKEKKSSDGGCYGHPQLQRDYQPLELGKTFDIFFPPLLCLALGKLQGYSGESRIQSSSIVIQIHPSGLARDRKEWPEDKSRFDFCFCDFILAGQD